MAISNVTTQKLATREPIFEKEYETTISEMGQNFGDFYKTLRNEKMSPVGTLTCTYLSEPDADLKNPLKYMISIQVKDATSATKSYKSQMTVKVVVKGAYNQISEGYKILSDYIVEKELEVVGPPFEIYTKGPKLGFLMIGLETEIHFPIKQF